MEKKALGRGLDALLPDTRKTVVSMQDIEALPVDRVRPNPYQPRTEFAEEELAQLAESVKRNGVLQPVLVRRKADGAYELIAGERRLRAAKLAGLATIPAVVRNSSDEQAMELALVENLQRRDLNPMEAARAYYRLTHEFGFTQDTIASRVGKDRSSIANLSRLINLPKEIQELVEAGKLSTGHAKVLLSIARVEQQLRLARLISDGQLSVRQAEHLAAQDSRPKRRVAPAKPYPELEERLRKRLGTKVTIQKGRKGGTIVLHYFSQEELDGLLDALLT